MFDLILRRARLCDEQLVDIALRDGKIAVVGNVTGSAQQERDLGGRWYVSAGWIDSHVHCYAKSPVYHDEADAVGVRAAGLPLRHGDGAAVEPGT